MAWRALRDVSRRSRCASRPAARMSPLGVLSRGYAVCWNAERSAIIRDAAKVTAGEEVHVTLHSGALDCTVTRVE